MRASFRNLYKDEAGDILLLLLNTATMSESMRIPTRRGSKDACKTEETGRHAHGYTSVVMFHYHDTLIG